MCGPCETKHTTVRKQGLLTFQPSGALLSFILILHVYTAFRFAHIHSIMWQLRKLTFCLSFWSHRDVSSVQVLSARLELPEWTHHIWFTRRIVKLLQLAWASNQNYFIFLFTSHSRYVSCPTKTKYGERLKFSRVWARKHKAKMVVIPIRTYHHHLYPAHSCKSLLILGLFQG